MNNQEHIDTPSWGETLTELAKEFRVLTAKNRLLIEENEDLKSQLIFANYSGPREITLEDVVEREKAER